MSDLHFDSYQFEGRRHPVRAEFTQDGWTSNGISHEDYKRGMGTQNSSVPLRHCRWIPAFAVSDLKLRRVIIERGWLFIHNTRYAERPPDWKSLNGLATKKALEFGSTFKNCPDYKKCEHEAFVSAVRHAGGYMELQAALAYRAWRLREDSCAIADALKMSPQGVRVNLQRLCNVARSLGFETFAVRHSSFQRPRPKAQGTARIIALYQRGKTVSEIAQAIGYPKGHGNNKVRHALLKAGIYKGRGHAAGQRVN